MKGINVYRRPQVIKLSTLIDFYEADPESNYKIVIQNGVIRTLVEANKTPSISEEYELSIQSQNFTELQPVGKIAKKSVGLFSNVIKHMDTNRQYVEEHQDSKSRGKRPYQFYFQHFNNSSGEQQFKPLEGTSVKRVKERVTGKISVDHRKQEIRINNQCKQNQNQLNSKKQIKLFHNNQQNQKQTFIDINFSFEEINEQLQAKKFNQTQKDIVCQNFEKMNEVTEPSLLKKQSSGKDAQKVGIKQTQNQNQCRQLEESSKQICIPKSLAPIIDDFSLEFGTKKDVFSPIPHKSRHQIRIKEHSKVDLNNKSLFSVEGAKKAESRVYNNSSNDSKDIKIEFDLDIDF